MDDTDGTYLYTQESEYTNRVPTPPRINIPPPTMRATPANLHVRPAYGDAVLEALRFLDEYNYDFCADSPPSTICWNYENRRQAQKILPFLYLGPMNAVSDRDFLRRENITMLLAIRPTSTTKSLILNRALSMAEKLELQKGTVDVATMPELIAAFPMATRTINEHMLHMRQNSMAGKVLVFCETGNDRSAAVVVAYLMQMFADMDLVRAIQQVQARRFCINVDDSMKHLLSSYWEILKAKQDVAAATQQNNPSQQAAHSIQIGLSKSDGGIGSKRGHDDFFDDEAMGDFDVETSARGIAPFRDVENGE
ncbi:phosphatases II [Viridothelium virens]|uniref:Phosphatases II n=1 Tax=Viridothelium virens TaxID=1048519 RepID=A0A6A6GZQ7_VIRVR|nr:phosphatases II [Viridothelium virens]